MRINRHLHGSLPFFLCLALLRHCAAICYYPNGDASPQDLPCRDGTDHSTCCGPGYACLSNNICMATGLERQIPNAAKYDRGSCTDKTWRSGQCPNFCVNAAHDDTLEGGMGIAKCPGAKDMYYCMDGFPFDCATGENVLSFSGSPTAITTIGFDTATTAPSASSSLTSSARSSTVTSLLSPTPAAVTTSPSMRSDGASYTTSSSSSTFTSTVPTPLYNASGPTSSGGSPNTEEPTTPSSNAPSTALIAGVAAGVAIGVIGLATIAFMGYRRWLVRRQVPTARRQDSEEPCPQHSAPVTWEAGDKQSYGTYKAHLGHPAQLVVHELPAERLRMPELPSGGA